MFHPRSYKKFVQEHNEIIEQAEQLQAELRKLKAKADAFYNTMRWENTGLREEQYESLYALVRCIEDEDVSDTLEAGLNMLEAVAKTGKVVIPDV